MAESRNPPWTRDELILALDLYFRVNPIKTTAQNPLIRELSRLLNTLPFHPASEHRRAYRNPTGVYMTLCTFLRFDPDYKGKGLRGNSLGQQVWDEFANDRTRLGTIAKAIQSAAITLATHEPQHLPGEEDENEFPEGRVLACIHRLRERNPALVKRKKEQVLLEKGHLSCEVCGFDFQEVYGSLGAGFAECHHGTPLSELPGSRVSKIADLAIVCANCHRMLHRARPWMSVEDLRGLICPASTISDQYGTIDG